MEIHCGSIELKILNLTISQLIRNECHSYLKLHQLYLDTEEEHEYEPLLTSQPGLGSQSRSELGVFGSLEPEPLEEKNRSRSCLEKNSGARATKKLAGSSALREDKKYKEIVL